MPKINVFLICGGPGEKELITVRGLNILSKTVIAKNVASMPKA